MKNDCGAFCSYGLEGEFNKFNESWKSLLIFFECLFLLSVFNKKSTISQIARVIQRHQRLQNAYEKSFNCSYELWPILYICGRVRFLFEKFRHRINLFWTFYHISFIYIIYLFTQTIPKRTKEQTLKEYQQRIKRTYSTIRKMPDAWHIWWLPFYSSQDLRIHHWVAEHQNERSYLSPFCPRLTKFKCICAKSNSYECIWT